MMITTKRIRCALVAGIAISACLSGCGDDTAQKKNPAVPQTTATTTPKIEVVANKDAKEIKVKTKVKTGDGNSSYYYDYNVKSEYDLKSQPANKDAAVKVRPRTKVDANLHIRSPYEHVEIELLVKRLSTTFRIKCSACHDDYANGIIGPSLLSRDSNYIYDKIAEFKSGKKSNPLMDDLIKMMSDEEIRVLADEIYEFNKEVKKIREKK
jgi:cytochrome c553